jgi:2,3-diketo-5-methylthio-1-phosphopentane phosphatase
MASLGDASIQAILLDIEGTTTPVDFVHNVLFSYARGHLGKFVHQPPEPITLEIEELRKEHAADKHKGLDPPGWVDSSADLPLASLVNYVEWLMDRDRKSAPLKSLQGKIWVEGYRSGELRSEIYADVPAAFMRWSQQQRDICIFSSGSRLAQKLLFAHTSIGDLTGFIREYFDTTVGTKTTEQSYSRIAATLQVPSSRMVFVSDTVKELEAAQVAGMKTLLCVRSPKCEVETSGAAIVHTFDEIFP